MRQGYLLGSYIWTACSAGWLVIGYVTGVEMAYAVGVGCGCMSALFLYCGVVDKVEKPDEE